MGGVRVEGVMTPLADLHVVKLSGGSISDVTLRLLVHANYSVFRNWQEVRFLPE